MSEEYMRGLLLPGGMGIVFWLDVLFSDPEDDGCVFGGAITFVFFLNSSLPPPSLRNCGFCVVSPDPSPGLLKKILDFFISVFFY